MAFQLWNSIMESKIETYLEICKKVCYKKQKGKCYTFSKFIDTLIKISYLYARDSQEISSNNEIPSEIFTALLEKMELSLGFLNLEKKTNKPHTSRTSLLPSHEILTLIDNAKQGNAEEVINYIREK